MLKKSIIHSLGFVALSVSAFSAQAAPFSYEYNDTISLSTVAGLTAGDAAKIIVTLDNGGGTDINQTWAAADLVSVTYSFDNGTVETTFNSPWGGDGLNISDGDFVTNASGTLTSVLAGWADFISGEDFITNGFNPQRWRLLGNNAVYFNLAGQTVSLTNVGNMLDAANWTQVSAPVATPIPAAVWLFGTGLVGLIGASKRKKANALQAVAA